MNLKNKILLSIFGILSVASFSYVSLSWNPPAIQYFLTVIVDFLIAFGIADIWRKKES